MIWTKEFSIEENNLKATAIKKMFFVTGQLKKNQMDGQDSNILAKNQGHQE